MPIVFLYNKSNVYGLQQDVQVLEKALSSFGKILIADPQEHPVVCDIAIHFEVPYYGWMAWARRNVFVVNPEWWEDAWAPYLLKADALIFKCAADRKVFADKFPGIPESYILPWTTPVKSADFATFPKGQEKKILWLLGASQNKRAAAEKILPLWKLEWPELHVYSTTSLDVATPANVFFNVRDLDKDFRRQLQAYYPGHMIFSAAEALGMVAMEGQAAGAFLLGNSLPTYLESFKDNTYVSLTKSTLEPFKGGFKDTFESLDLQSCVDSFLTTNVEACRKSQIHTSIKRFLDFNKRAETVFKSILSNPGTSLKILPPNLEELPSISVITLLHNRRKFVDLAFHNLLITDYPKDKIEWVVIEDSDDLNQQASDKVIKFGSQSAPLTVSYIPLHKKTSIGEKRNLAVARAQHDIILMMDDDDHYPSTSFRRRVSWLLQHPWNPSATVCTTIACYDLIKGISAVNTPPWSLGLGQRVSEATLTFKKSWWVECPFPNVSVSEGEGIITGRENTVLEMPPQQIIVAMSHGKNSTGRRIPPDSQPSCFWGFPKEFLIFLHRLADVEVDESAS